MTRQAARTTADWEFAKGGVNYFVESRTLTGPQRKARRVLGDAYKVERWGYDWVRRVGLAAAS